MDYRYTFTGEVDRVFGHLAHRGTGTDGATYGNADVTLGGEPVTAEPNQTVHLFPGDDVVLSTDEPQTHPELVPASPDATSAAAHTAAQPISGDAIPPPAVRETEIPPRRRKSVDAPPADDTDTEPDPTAEQE